MDSQTTFVTVIASLAMLIFGSFYLGSGPSTADGVDAQDARPQPVYTPDDIRYKYQQEDIRKKQKELKLHPGGMPKTSGGANSSGADSGAGDDSGSDDEPSLSDHEPQEEPELQ